jgi:hypothetical protein
LKEASSFISLQNEEPCPFVCAISAAIYRLALVEWEHEICTGGDHQPEKGEKGNGKGKIVLIKHHAMKMCRGVEVLLHAFLTSALDGSEWSASRPSRFTPCERPSSTLWTVKSRSGRCGEERNLLTLPRNRILVLN